LGVTLLMFIVELELSFSKMVTAPRAAFGLGGLQLLLTAIAIALLLVTVGFEDPVAAAILGGALAMSSTAIAAKHLAEQEELASQHGRLAIGVLLFKDLATLPLLVFVDHRGTGSISPDSRTIWATVIFLGIYFCTSTICT
jgi:CPA2 family monovalent cation:H+ antiporter-2